MVDQLSSSYLLAQGSTQQYELLRKAHYEVDIEGLDCILLAQDVTMPRIEFEAVEVFHYNDRVKAASGPNVSDMRVELLDATDPNIVTQIWNWCKLIYDPRTGEMGLAANYKRQGMVHHYGPDKTLIRTWTCEGMWPKNSPTPEEAYSYRSRHEVVTFGMVFSVDRCTLDGASGAIAVLG